LSGTGLILRADLSRGTTREERIDPSINARFVGGRGLGAKIVSDETDPRSDPLAPERRIVFAAGPLSGTGAPTSGRFSASFKSPLTGLLTDSNCGGFFGPWIKMAGYDAIVLQGRAEAPSYLVVSDEGSDILGAQDLWGELTGETNRILEERHQGKVACIGPAGERSALISNVIVNGRRALGRGGLGAVMGSKNLKAVVVSGKRRVEVEDEGRFGDAVDRARSLINRKLAGGWGLASSGTASILGPLNVSGILPVKNFQASQWPSERAEEVDGERLRQDIFSGRQGCATCPVVCGHWAKLPGGETVKGPEFETLWSFGPNLDCSDLLTIVRAGDLCDQYGLDSISTGSTMAAAAELLDRGMIQGVCGWNDPARILDTIKKIGEVEDEGEELAAGARRLCRGRGVPEASMDCHGLELPAYDPRGVQGMGLAYATSNRGGCHMRAYTVLSELSGRAERFSTEGKAELVMRMQDETAFVDSLVLCRFVQPLLGEKIPCDLYNGAEGSDIGPEELLEIGGRIFNLERLFNLGAGISEETLPRRLLEEGVADGPSKGRVVSLDEMLVEYRRLRGWTREGEIRDETMRRYGLSP
jgi:aldehyde:ferredoxin oxidoreductase